VIPVIDLRRCLGLNASGLSQRSRIVVAEVGGNVLGFLVDQVSEVLRISAGSVEAPPAPRRSTGVRAWSLSDGRKAADSDRLGAATHHHRRPRVDADDRLTYTKTKIVLAASVDRGRFSARAGISQMRYNFELSRGQPGCGRKGVIFLSLSRNGTQAPKQTGHKSGSGKSAANNR